jgi:hypothetical protein
MPGASADEIDEIGNEVTAKAKALVASANQRRRHASGGSSRHEELDRQVAAIEQETAIDLERSEERLHNLADIKRRVAQ